MSRRRPLGLGVALVVGLSSAGCSSSNDPAKALFTQAEWKDDPGSAAEIGYWVSVDVGWPSRTESCFPLSPALHVTVNDREAGPIYTSDCEWDILVEVGPFAADDPGPTTVRLLDGTHVLGEAIYDGLFPGFSAQLVSPADGMVRAGEQVAIALTAPLPAEVLFDRGPARFYWLDPPDDVPPFYSSAIATMESDRQSIAVPAPALTGRAAMVIRTFDRPRGSARSCVGFTSCAAWPSENIGPVFVEVIP